MSTQPVTDDRIARAARNLVRLARRHRKTWTGPEGEKLLELVDKQNEEKAQGITPLNKLVEDLRASCNYHERMMYQCGNESREVDEAHHAGRLKQAEATLEFIGESREP
jgi:hypothetical protein